MIDTVRLKFPIALSPAQLQFWDRQTRTKATGQVSHKCILNLSTGGVSIRGTYYPYDYHDDPLLALEFSLPKVIYGNNFTMLGSLDEAIVRVNLLLTGFEALPPLDISEGGLLRLDPCYNHHVGPLVPDFINAIGHLEFPHRRTKHHKDEGAEFRAKHTTTKFYDKMRECGDPKASGILRQEATYLNPKRIAQLVGMEHPTLGDVPPRLVAELLRSDLAKLHLDTTSIADRDTALARLCAEYGPRAGLYYWALLKAKNDTSRRQLRSRTTLHSRSLDRTLKRITDAGLALTVTDTNEPLPPLEIDL